MKKLLFFAFAALAMLACSDKNAPSGPQTKEGLKGGVFSVSASTKVQFSQSNLQYQATTDTWRFSENQYDIIGAANEHISNSYAGWIDLFGWGTGNNPILASTSANTGYNSFAEWGRNKIVNGGEKDGIWRTLTADEWLYLFHGRERADSLLGMGCVNGVNGVIILPDTCIAPDDFCAASDTTLIWNTNGYSNENGKNFTHNVYTAEQWKSMEELGAIFLPAAGYRAGNTVHNVGAYGNYWSSTPDKEGVSYYLSFNAESLCPKCNDYHHGSRYYGYTIRLVQNVR